MTNATLSSTDRPELDFLGARVTVLADGDATGGAFGLVDMREIPAGSMPPLHIHHHEDEWFYVLDGEAEFFLPGRSIPVRAGDFLLAPRGVPHAYRIGERPARWLALSSPSGFERFVVDVAALGEADPGALARVARQHDIEILGPPGTLP